jgi:alpha-mannosidase
VPCAAGRRGADAVALAEEFRNDVLVVRGTAPGAGPLPEDTTGLRVEGRDVQVSAVRRVKDEAGGTGTEIRLVAMSDAATPVRVTGPFTRATAVDLLGRPLAPMPVRDGLAFTLDPWEIRTVVLS